MKEIRWGIVGPGIIANKFASAVKNVKGAVLTSVSSRSEERGRAFAETYGIENVFSSYEAMAESDKVDAVYISTPHPFHKPCAELFLNKGKAVLCEKPVCVNAEKARQLAACAEKNGVFLMEAMWTRFLPAVMKAAEVAKSDRIGKIMSLNADFCYLLGEGEDPKLLDNRLAGGSLLDVGIYCLHFADLFLGDSPTETCAMARTQNGVDMGVSMMLRYAHGAVAALSSGMDVTKPPVATVCGTHGYIVIPDFYKAREFTVYVGGEEEKICLSPVGDGFEEEIYEVCRAVREGRTESELLPMSKSIRMLEISDRIRNQIGISYPDDN